MYRYTTVGSLPLGLSRRFLASCMLFACMVSLCGLALFSGSALHAQSTSGGGIQGTVTDPSGAVVRDAEITATNTDTGVQMVRKSNGSGVYSLQPLQAGPYIVEVVAKGFQRLLQQNITVDNASVVGLNIKLTVGESGVREWTIGSQADREVQFQDSGVSALHAKIVNEGERWKVLDQMSANGTYVNGKRSNVSYLSAGDRVRFGPVECIFQTSRAGTAPRRSPSSSGGGERGESKSKTLLIAGIAFVVTIVVLFLVYKFVL